MKSLFYYLAVLLCVAMLLFSCNRIDTVSFDNESVATKDMTSAHSLKVTHQEAQGVADMFLRSEAGSVIFQTKSAKAKRVSSSSTVREDGQELMYIFNYDDGGFVIVGATRDYYPILAYSDKGSFVLREDMGPVDVWLDETKVCIKNSSLLDETTKAQMQNLWVRYDGTYVNPTQQLLAARRPQTRSTGEDYCWDRIDYLQALYGSEGWTFLPLSQVEGMFTDLGLSNEYNTICYYAAQNHSALDETLIGYLNPVMVQVGPLIQTQWHQSSPFGSLCINGKAGCGPVAAGQVMLYHQYPPLMTLNGITFGWNQIPAAVDSTSKQPHLMRLLGLKFNTVYGPNGSETSDYGIYNGLDSLGFVTNYQTHDATAANTELFNNHRPVIMGGSRKVGNNYLGHTWVCEGVKDYFYYQLYYYTENQPYGAGNFTQGMYSYNNPGLVGNTYYPVIYFYMNWGWHDDVDMSDADGWYGSNDVNSGFGDYRYCRKNIYVSLQQ